MTSPSALGIVIVNWNTRIHLLKALELLCQPSAPDLHIVVIDNASEDGSVAAVAAQFPKVQVIANSENLGYAAAVNQGAAQIQQPCILVMNADVQCPLATVVAMELSMRQNPRMAAVGPQLFNSDGTLQLSWGKDPSLVHEFVQRWWWRKLEQQPGQRILLHAADHPKKVDWILGACFLVRKEAFDQVGGMERSFFMYFEEADLFRRLRNANWDVWYLPSVQAIHEGRASTSQNSVRMMECYRKSQIQYYRRHNGMVQTALLIFYLAIKRLLGGV